jgi:hypothetical protein
LLGLNDDLRIGGTRLFGLIDQGEAGITTADEIDDAITRANEIDDRPVVIDFRIMAEEKVYPMVPSGATNSDLVVPPSQTDLPR